MHQEREPAATSADGPVGQTGKTGPVGDTEPDAKTGLAGPAGGNHDGGGSPAAGAGATDTGPRRSVIRTGAEQPWDPEDLAVAEGRDPTPANVERARQELERLGPAAIERTVP